MMDRVFCLFERKPLKQVGLLKSELDSIKFLTNHPKQQFIVIEKDRNGKTWARLEGTNLHGFVIRYESE